METMSHIPDLRADGISTNDYCALLPRRRYEHEARGRILLLPRTGLVVVPFEELKDGGWYVAVVEGRGAYPVGGYHLYASKVEIETAIELTLGEPAPAVIVNTAEEAEALEDGAFILTRDHGGLSKKSIDGEARWTRSILKRVSLRTEEIADQFPVVVRRSKETASV
jgi:hypothetical protein